MPKAKSSSKNEKDPELNIKWSGPEFWKDWSKKGKKNKSGGGNGGGGALYFVGFVGALVYNMQAAVGFGAVVTGILKAIVWPAYIVYKLLELFYGAVN